MGPFSSIRAPFGGSLLRYRNHPGADPNRAAVAAGIAGVTFLLIRARGGSLVDEDATVTSRSAGERRIITNTSTRARAGNASRSH